MANHYNIVYYIKYYIIYCFIKINIILISEVIIPIL